MYNVKLHGSFLIETIMRFYHCKHLHHQYLIYTKMLFYLQQVYMYFRGSGKAAEMKREAARGAMRAAM